MGKLIAVCIFILISCSKENSKVHKTYNLYGIETKECRIRNADGSGPYELIGKYTEEDCKKQISEKCNLSKYKQVHRNKGHFARGKFGETIMIGTCP